jgi:hypothetical protein
MKKGLVFLYSTQHGLYFDSDWMSSLVVPNVMITEGTNPIARIRFNGRKFVTWKHTFHAEEYKRPHSIEFDRQQTEGQHPREPR